MASAIKSQANPRHQFWLGSTSLSTPPDNRHHQRRDISSQRYGHRPTYRPFEDAAHTPTANDKALKMREKEDRADHYRRHRDTDGDGLSNSGYAVRMRIIKKPNDKFGLMTLFNPYGGLFTLLRPKLNEQSPFADFIKDLVQHNWQRASAPKQSFAWHPPAANLPSAPKHPLLQLIKQP